MKNYFGGQAPFHSFNRWIDNQSGTTLTYTTYSANRLQIPVNINLLSDFTPTNAPGVSKFASMPNDLTQAQELCGGLDNYPDTGVNPARPRGATPEPLGTVAPQFAGNNLTVVPNPADAQVEVWLRLPVSTPTLLTLYDGLGRVVRRLTLTTWPAEQPVTLSLRELPAGLYHCAVTAPGTRVLTCKVLVQH